MFVVPISAKEAYYSPIQLPLYVNFANDLLCRIYFCFFFYKTHAPSGNENVVFRICFSLIYLLTLPVMNTFYFAGVQWKLFERLEKNISLHFSENFHKIKICVRDLFWYPWSKDIR